MRTKEQIGVALIRLGRRRLAEMESIALTDDELGRLLTEAKTHPEVTMTEAAKLAGIGRPLAYKLMAKVGGSES